MPTVGRARSVPLLLITAFLFTPPSAAPAQSLVAGSVSGEVRGEDGLPLEFVRLVLSGGDVGENVAYSRRNGRFVFADVAPGRYTLLVEIAGFQPVRYHGVGVEAGQRLDLAIELEKRPPPVLEVEDRPAPLLISGSSLGEGESNSLWLRRFDWRRPATGLGRDMQVFLAPDDQRNGLALTSGGLPAAFNRLYMDGVEEFLIRHPGLPADPAHAPVFSRGATGSALGFASASDAEWAGTGGGLLSLTSRKGTADTRVRPWTAVSSAGLGGRSENNPADSSTISIQGGATLSGGFAGGKGRYLLGGEYLTLERPSANVSESDASAIAQVASDSFGVSNAFPYVRPVIRSWRGGNAFGRADYRTGIHAIVFRAGVVDWSEQNPPPGSALVSGLGTRLEASDISTMAGLTSTPGKFTNELRVGFRRASRNWIAGGLPETRFTAEGAAIGVAATRPGEFNNRVLYLSDALQWPVGDHRLKVGITGELEHWEQDYIYGRSGVFTFGSLDQFAEGTGAFYQASNTAGPVSFDVRNGGVFVQDTWSPMERLQLRAGLRYDIQDLPSDAITLDSAFAGLSGFVAETSIRDGNDIAPRGGFSWVPDQEGHWLVEGGGGFFYHGIDLALFSEAALYDGGVRVRRQVGDLSNWPSVNSDSVPFANRQLTLFRDSYQNPRTGKLTLEISRRIGGATVELSGNYFHTDYLPRRTDLNLSTVVSGSTQDGRAVYGTLVKQGGSITVEPGTNRAIPGYDLVLGIAPTGFSDYYALTLSVERLVAERLRLNAAWTWSRTTDNTPLLWSGNPVDLVSPFAGQTIEEDWRDGRSDLDIPHRVTVSAEYRMPGSLDLVVGGRYRFRSGLPFTPGFRDGVDVNGDGSGRNDPVALDATVPGVAELMSGNPCLSDTEDGFAARNSCRDPSHHALDLHLALGLGIRSLGAPLYLTLDAFNVVASSVGIRDHAALLVDTGQPLVVDGSGNVTIPVVANPGFGELLARRGEDRVIRLGLRVGE